MQMDAQIHADNDGTILFDADTVPRIDHAWFDPVYWERVGALQGRGGGRASACFIDTPAGACVLRHYHRGGMVANLLGDRYLWTGRENTRCFAEFRLLARMLDMQLPVPAPVAARYRRHGLRYSADLITRRIDQAQTLSECLQAGRLDAGMAEECGMLVGRFHARGVWHADLNAHNILVTPGGMVMIDFDRGRMRQPASAWREANLSRLQRSLLKLGAARDGEDAFLEQTWMPLMRGYAGVMEKTA